MELLFPLEHPVAGWRPLLIYINYSNPQGWLQIQSYWANAHINKNLEVWFMAISSAVEVYTILQRHLDTLLIISIMYLKRQSVDSRLKISLIKVINLSELLLIGLRKRRNFPNPGKSQNERHQAGWCQWASQVHQAQQLGKVKDLPWHPDARPAASFCSSQTIPTLEWNDLRPSKQNNNSLMSSW